MVKTKLESNVTKEEALNCPGYSNYTPSLWLGIYQHILQNVVFYKIFLRFHFFFFRSSSAQCFLEKRELKVLFLFEK